MKITISAKHEYLSGWTTYDMTWKTDYTGIRNKTIQSVVVASKEPFSTKILKVWANGKGYDLDALFTDTENIKDDCNKTNEVIKLFSEEYGKNIEKMNSSNKCMVSYTATLNPNYKPLHTAFETFLAYDVMVRIEYKTGVISGVFPSMGRKKNAACTMVVFSDNKLKAVYEEEEAIEKVKCNIEHYINDCDSDEKFAALYKKMEEIRKYLQKQRG